LSISDVKNGYKRLILKLSEVLLSEEVEGPYMHLNQRLIPIQKWYHPRDIHLTRMVLYIPYKKDKSRRFCTKFINLDLGLYKGGILFLGGGQYDR
jgi:hypothetical protein